ncbi:MAG: hypothetical protein QW379_02805 [Thermoplasmata archaeon]
MGKWVLTRTHAWDALDYIRCPLVKNKWYHISPTDYHVVIFSVSLILGGVVALLLFLLNMLVRDRMGLPDYTCESSIFILIPLYCLGVLISYLALRKVPTHDVNRYRAVLWHDDFDRDIFLARLRALLKRRGYAFQEVPISGEPDVDFVFPGRDFVLELFFHRLYITDMGESGPIKEVILRLGPRRRQTGSFLRDCGRR